MIVYVNIGRRRGYARIEREEKTKLHIRYLPGPLRDPSQQDQPTATVRKQQVTYIG